MEGKKEGRKEGRKGGREGGREGGRRNDWLYNRMTSQCAIIDNVVSINKEKYN